MWPAPLAGSPGPGCGRDAGAALATLDQGQAEPSPAVYLGEEYRLGATGLTGAALVAQGQAAHLMAFPVVEAPEASGAPEANQ